MWWIPQSVYTPVMGFKYKNCFFFNKMLVWLTIGAVLFLLCFVVFMNCYKNIRIAQSLRQLDLYEFDHYEITEKDREMQEARALGEVKS